MEGPKAATLRDTTGEGTSIGSLWEGRADVALETRPGKVRPNMVPLALTRTERRLVKASVAPSIVAAVVAFGYAMVWYFSQAGPDDRWLVLLFCTLGYLPVWIALAAALKILGDLRASPWMDTRELAPATAIFALCAILTIFTTEYHSLEPSAPWMWASLMPAVSAVLVGAAWGMSLMRRWRRRDQSRWTPGIGAAR